MRTNYTLSDILSKRSSWFLPSNCLTFLRILLVPFILLSMHYAAWRVAFVLFCCAAATDVLDGFVARLRREASAFGAVLDPIADKILMVSMFCGLVCYYPDVSVIPQWFIFFLIIRELLLVSGVLFLAFVIKKDVVMQPSYGGKLGTFIQVVFIAYVLCSEFFLPKLPQVMFYGVVALLTVTFVHYAVVAFHQDTGDK